MKGVWDKLKKIDWEEYKRQREEVRREEELELGKAIVKFVLRFLWAVIRGKGVVKLWSTLDNGMKFFDLCERTEIVVEEDTICDGCFQLQKAGSRLSRLQSLFLLDEPEDMSLFMCEECADACTDKNRYQEYEKKRADIFGC